jgi:hypothetical protein
MNKNTIIGQLEDLAKSFGIQIRSEAIWDTMSRPPSMSMMDGKGAGLRVKSNRENSGRREYSPRRSFWRR